MIILVLQEAFTFISMIIIWYCSVRFQFHHVKLLIQMEDVLMELRRLGIWIYYPKKQKQMYCQIVLRLVIIGISITGQAASTHTRWRLIVYLGGIVSSIMFLLVSIYISAVKEYYGILNKYLSQLSNFKNEQIADTLKLEITSFLKTKLEILKIIVPLHHRLYIIMNTINHVFGVIFIALFGVTFILVIVDAYYLITLLDETQMQVIAVLCNCLPGLVDAIIICYLCNSMMDEIDLSGLLIHQLSIAESKDVKEQIDVLSLQLTQEKTEINAAGLFPVNYGLIFSIICGVITNLVILVQFSKSVQWNSKI
ncbi:putative gustatory receptor 28b isoform X1 [Photinus pyralis]|uniref:putative gustatory receptor 28b isoform X1 n=2 Tax=Photinus pyralis TaxID=7054 RepID=UPI001267052C|nr:putative gustatory receptor 28b isoform X1 [Photinus pyralis]XP_031345150.1 putative gustatory receptor 28b isoform X1 [Photinus pyralis]